MLEFDHVTKRNDQSSFKKFHRWIYDLLVLINLII